VGVKIKKKVKQEEREQEKRKEKEHTHTITPKTFGLACSSMDNHYQKKVNGDKARLEGIALWVS
jgi:hypothetical protein